MQQQKGTWTLRHLCLQTQTLPRIPTMAVLHHHVSTGPGLEGPSTEGQGTPHFREHDGLVGTFYKVFRQKYLCVNHSVQLLIRCFGEWSFVSGPALCIPGARQAAAPTPTPGPLPPLLGTPSSTLAAAMDHVQRAFHKLGLLSCIIGKYSADSPAAGKTICHF